jgi:hypothetical protein
MSDGCGLNDAGGMFHRGRLPVLVVLPLLAVISVSPGGVRAARSAAARPCVAPESDRQHPFRIDLDGDRRKELILVYNFDAAAAPVSMFMVCKRVHGDWVTVQRQTILQSPGARSSGLVDAWAGDLNKDRRVEIAARDFLTPSAGEVLSIYRQTRIHLLRFAKLQTIGGDQVTLHPHAGAAATVSVLLRANHSVDGRRHLQTWRWSSTAGRWTCRSDCRGFAVARQGRSVVASASRASQRITPAGVGKVKLGETYARLRARHLVGRIRKGCPLAGPNARSAPLSAPLKGSVDFTTTVPRKVTDIGVWGGATARGVGIGDTIADIKAAYPKAKVDHTTDDMFGITLVRIPKSGGGRLEFAVSTRTHKVVLIAIPSVAFCE